MAAATGQETTTGPKVLALWLESNRCIARAGQGEGGIALASATRFVNTESASNNSAFVSSAQGRASGDPAYLRRLARKLKVNGRQGTAGGAGCPNGGRKDFPTRRGDQSPHGRALRSNGYGHCRKSLARPGIGTSSCVDGQCSFLAPAHPSRCPACDAACCTASRTFRESGRGRGRSG